MSNKTFCAQNGISEDILLLAAQTPASILCNRAAEACMSGSSKRAGERTLYDSSPKQDAELEIHAGTDRDTIAMLQALEMHMIDLSLVENYYVACRYTNLRYGIDGLAVVLQWVIILRLR